MDADAEQVLAAARARAEALAAGEGDGLLALLHPDFAWTSHTGEAFDRASYVANNVGGPTRWSGQRLEDVEVVVAGEAAVLRCVVTDVVERPDLGAERTSYRMPMTQTWLRSATAPAGWLLLAGHAGPRWD